jgi:hypothetical protein
MAGTAESYTVSHAAWTSHELVLPIRWVSELPINGLVLNIRG